MASLEEIATLMEALGPHDDEIETITRNGETDWAVAFDADTILLLTYQAKQDKLVLSMTLATPPEGQRLAAYEAMLAYNLLWEETGGVKMALAGAHGPIVQLFELCTCALDLESLDTVLVNFALKARMWKDVIASGAFAEPDFKFEDQRELLIRA